MTIFNPYINNPINNNGGTQQINYPTVEPSRITKFGNINPLNNQIVRYNLLPSLTAKENNNTTNIRTTLTGLAIRNDRFNHHIGKFDKNFPGNDVYAFCNPELGIVFNHSASQYTRKFSKGNTYPLNITIEKVKNSIQNNQYGNNYTGNCVGCPGNVLPDPITGLCAPSQKCIPDPITPCPEPELINLKSTIYGYAYYLDNIKEVDIPNIGKQLVRCAGGHRCNRTHFRPKLKLNDNTIVEPSNNISLDNIDNIYPNAGSIPQYYPVEGFIPKGYGERSDSFTFTVSDPSLLDNTCEVYLECLSPGGCHASVTMIFLVGQRSDNDEYVLIFADCVAPGTLNAEFLGSVPCNDDPPIDCEEVPPPPPPPPTSPTSETPIPTPECQIDEDCGQYYVLTIDKESNPDECGDLFQYYYFATFADAANFGEQNPLCGPYSITETYPIKCCDGECYPDPNQMPFGTDEFPITCP